MDNEDEDCTDLRKKLLVTLKDISYLAAVVERKAARLLSGLESDEINITSLERIGVKMVELLKCMKANSTISINSLYEDVISMKLKDSDGAPLPRPLRELESVLDDCRFNVVVDNNGTCSFAKQMHRETMTDLITEPLKINSEAAISDANSDLKETTCDNLPTEHNADMINNTMEEQTSSTSKIVELSNNDDESNSEEISPQSQLSEPEENSQTPQNTITEKALKENQNTVDADSPKSSIVNENEFMECENSGSDKELEGTEMIEGKEDSLKKTENLEINPAVPSNNCLEEQTDDFSKLADELNDILQTNKTNNTEESFEDPYDLETLKFGSSSEEDLADLTDDFHDDHSYSATEKDIKVTDIENSVSSVPNNSDKESASDSLADKISPSVQIENFEKENENTESAHQSQVSTYIEEMSDRESLNSHSDDDSNAKENNPVKEIGIQEDEIPELREETLESNPVDNKLESLDADESTKNVNETQSTYMDSEPSEMNELDLKESTDPDIEGDTDANTNQEVTKAVDVIKNKFKYINEEHDYTSSNSSPSCDRMDRDETEAGIEDDSIVELNKLTNFSLESQDDEPALPQEKDIVLNEDKLEENEIPTSETAKEVGTDENNANGPEIPELGVLEPEIPENSSVLESPIPESASEQVLSPQSEKINKFADELNSMLDETLAKRSEIPEVKEEEELLDVTMEEYLEEVPHFQLRLKLEDESIHITDVGSTTVKTENMEISTAETEDIEIPTVDIMNDISNNILELLKEHPYREERTSELGDGLNDSQKVDEILKEFGEENSEVSSLIDSDSDLDLSESSVSSDKEEIDQTAEDEKLKKILKEYDLKELSVKLEQMKMSAKDVRKYSKQLNDDINWLCDLNNLNNKKKVIKTKKNRRKRLKKVSCPDISSSSLSGLSTSSDESENENKPHSPILNSDLEQRLDEILATTICNDFKSASETDKDSDSSNSDSDSTKKRKGERDQDKKDKSDKNKRELTKEELEKRAWRNDPLLRGNFSDSDSEKGKKKSKKTKKLLTDSEFNVASDQLDSDSETDEELRAKIRAKFEENQISPIKQNIPASESSDSDDSDIQFISPVKTVPNDADGETPSSSKGRKQIKSILSDNDLTQETIKAKKEEMERIERIKGRNKVIEKLSQSLSSQNFEEEIPPLILDADDESGQPLVQVHPIITKKLKPHQRDGIKFMWDSCYESVKRLNEHPGSGCILAHCMGLGKTMQVLALCHTLFANDNTKTKHILIVCPLSTVSNWKKETKFAFNGLSPSEKYTFFTLDGSNKGKGHCKFETVKSWCLRKKSVLILGYEAFVRLTSDVGTEKISSTLKQRILECLVNPGPDLLICDEGHLIKNKKALKSMALHRIKTRRRIILTGTPLQNNLLEYYHMVNFVKPNLLGNLQEFKTNFVNPITNGQFEDSNEEDIRLMQTRTHVLHKILVKTVQRYEDTELEVYLPPMHDFAVFVQMSRVQIDFYNYYSDMTKTWRYETSKQFLADFQVLQQLSTHPIILALMEKRNKKKVKEKDVITEEEPICSNVKGWWKEKMPEDSMNNIEYGNKLVVVKAIIEECEAVGDKLLIFSQNLAELDLIEHFLNTVGTEKCRSWKKTVDYFRMDGTVIPHERSVICDSFNDEKRGKVRLLLMSTKVGGLGLNLTAANRVIIMTVNWNPSFDTQSVFRVYRFGQKKEVYIYRLVALDTMESKVYQRQVTKLAIARRVVDQYHIMRHYKSVDLQELYSCRPDTPSERPPQKIPDDELLATIILKLPCIFKYHEHKSLLVDRPEDKLSEQELATAWEDFKNNKHNFKPPPPTADPQQLQNDPSMIAFMKAYNMGDINRTNNELYNQYNLMNQSFLKRTPQYNSKTITVMQPNYLNNTTNPQSRLTITNTSQLSALKPGGTSNEPTQNTIPQSGSRSNVVTPSQLTKQVASNLVNNNLFLPSTSGVTLPIYLADKPNQQSTPSVTSHHIPPTSNENQNATKTTSSSWKTNSKTTNMPKMPDSILKAKKQLQFIEKAIKKHPGFINPLSSKPNLVKIKRLQGPSSIVIPDDTVSKQPNLVKNPLHQLKNVTIVSSQKPSIADSQKSSIANSQKPSSANSRKPSSANSQKPSSANSQKPSSANSQKPSSANSQKPSTANSRKPSRVSPHFKLNAYPSFQVVKPNIRVSQVGTSLKENSVPATAKRKSDTIESQKDLLIKRMKTTYNQIRSVKSGRADNGIKRNGLSNGERNTSNTIEYINLDDEESSTQTKENGSTDDGVIQLF